MANPEHVAILKQGVEVWNRWREENPDVMPDLNEASFYQSKLNTVNLSDTDLSGANLSKTELVKADLSRANLSRADLIAADLSNANLSGANLNAADLYEANLNGTDLRKVNFNWAELGWTNLGDVDLSTAIRIDKVLHVGPSYIDFRTAQRSQGKISETFLKGAGVPDFFIAHIISLRGIATQYHSCFISHSSQDEVFAQHLHADLQQKGVRCWFAPEDMRIGDKIRSAIDQSIRLHDKLLLVLSENSLNSFWVESEVEKAFEEERQRGQTVLFPVRLDEAVMDTGQPWAAEIRRTRHIGDFSRWKDHDSYQAAFERLLRDLKAEE